MSPATINTFGTQTTLAVGAQQYEIFRLDALERDRVGPVSRLPFSLKVLLENLLRHEDGRFVHPEDIEALAKWQPNAAAQKEIAFMPARDRKSTRLNSSHRCISYAVFCLKKKKKQKKKKNTRDITVK